MNYKEINKELKKLLPKSFINSAKDDLDELDGMTFPRGFKGLYDETSPKENIVIGKFVFLKLEDLIDLNVWDNEGSKLYEEGFSIVGLNDNEDFVCLNTPEKNKAGFNDVLLANRETKIITGNRKMLRNKMKFLSESFEEFLSKELKFFKKKNIKQAV
jgi:hypothetical protein